MNNKYSATVLGATGVVGRALVNALCRDERYYQVTCLVRSPLSNKDYHDPNKKIQAVVIDFDNLQDYQGYFTVDHVYCCLGTTLKQAGSKKAFRRVDFEFVHIAAQLSRAQRVKGFVWISSVGADAKSRFFYLRVKGELENAIMKMPQLQHAAAVRPSLIVAERKDNRLLEKLAFMLLTLVDWLLVGLLKKYRSVQPQQVAAQMIRLQKF
ncbi:NAD(P)H-binding protein [Glaciecola sp. 1036]|uniref:NAD(P)H-binding protein n=1 Tax=Alteromonadaceae TaxID=72275 RepID=UPI003D001D65